MRKSEENLENHMFFHDFMVALDVMKAEAHREKRTKKITTTMDDIKNDISDTTKELTGNVSNCLEKLLSAQTTHNAEIKEVHERLINSTMNLLRGAVDDQKKLSEYHRYLEDGLIRFEQNRFKEAKGYFSKALKIKQFPGVRHYLGAAKIRLQEYLSGIIDLSESIDGELSQGTTNADSYIERAFAFLHLNCHEGAKHDFREVLNYRPDSITSRAAIEFLKGNFNEVISLLSVVWKDPSKWVEASAKYYIENVGLYIKSLINATQYDIFLENIDVVLNPFENKPSKTVYRAYLYLTLTQVHLKMGNTKEADVSFNQAKTLLPENLLPSFKKYNTDPEALFRVLKLCKNKIEENGFYCEIYNHVKELPLLTESGLLSELNQGDLISDLTFQVKYGIWPKENDVEYRKRSDADKWNVLGFLYSNSEYREKSQKTARVCFEKAHRVDPKNRVVLYNLGITYAYHTDLETDEQKAKEFFDAADKAGHAKAKLQALKCEMKILKFSKTNPDHWNNLGIKYLEKEDGRPADSSRRRLCYEQALEHDGEHMNANCNLAMLFKYNNEVGIDHEKAKLYFKKSAEKGKENAMLELLDYELSEKDYGDISNDDAWCKLGYYYKFSRTESNNRSKAVLCYQKALKINASNSTALLNLAGCYIFGRGVDKDYDKARTFISELKSLKFFPETVNRYLGIIDEKVVLSDNDIFNRSLAGDFDTEIILELITELRQGVIPQLKNIDIVQVETLLYKALCQYGYGQRKNVFYNLAKNADEEMITRKLRFYKVAADAGNIKASYEFGILLTRAEDFDLAKEYLGKAFKGNNQEYSIKSAWALARVFRFTKDYDKSLEKLLFLEGVLDADSERREEALLRICNIYRLIKPTRTEENIEILQSAKPYYKELAENGNVIGCYTYGRMLFYGIGVAENRERAKPYLKKASEGGSKEAKDFYELKYNTTCSVM